MKKILKKNQVIITSLAVLIAVAGYLNFADVDLGFKDQAASTDGSSILEDVDYDLTDETALLDENGADGSLSDVSDQATSTPGEAVLTAASDFAAQAKLSREQIRSQNKADLQAIINNQELGDDQKQEAVSTMVSMADLTEKESAAELLRERDRQPHRGNGRHRSAGSRPKRCQKGTDRGHCKAQNRNRPGEHCDHAAEREHGRLCR